MHDQQRWQIPVTGMTCDHCTQSVGDALRRVPGVQTVEVDLASSQAAVEGDPRTVTRAALEHAISAAGYSVGAPAHAAGGSTPLSADSSFVSLDRLPASAGASGVAKTTKNRLESAGRTEDLANSSRPLGVSDLADSRGAPVVLAIEGMHCASCVGRVQSALAHVPGVSEAHVNLVTQQARVAWRGDAPAVEPLLAAVRSAGYTARVMADGTTAIAALGDQIARDTHRWRWRLALGAALLAPLLWLHASGYAHRISPWWELLLATPVQLVLGWPFCRGALARLRQRSTNMDTLVALGTTTAYVAGIMGLLRHSHNMYFMDGAMILVFITLGRYLEGLARGQASAGLRSLVNFAPHDALVIRAGQPTHVPIDAVAVGELLVVRPGAKVPLDAKVVSGTGTVDESWLTGEALPMEKGPGDSIYAGTLNGSGALTGRVTHLASETLLAQVVNQVAHAQESKSQFERLADQIVGKFVPVVIICALLAALAWVVFAGDWSAAAAAAVAVLVGACPCALGLATPTAVLVASARAARQGILIKDARVLEAAGEVTTVLLDKTGTVTSGRPEVTCVLAALGYTDDGLLAIAAAAERLSDHPLARTVVEEAQCRQLRIPQADSLSVVPGQGIRARVDGHEVLIGNERLLESAGVSLGSMADHIASLREDGETVLLVAAEGKCLGLLALADLVAPHSAEAVTQLQTLGLDVRLLSGDHRRTVEAVGRRVGIEKVTAEVLPNEKAGVVEQLRAEGRNVAMVGDGINDAAALSTANVGMAIGTGADVAIEAADVVLVRADLRGVPELIALARATRRTIRQNIAWAFGYNLLLIPLAAGALAPWLGRQWQLPPAVAAAAMAVSSVAVVTNSLRLRSRAATEKRISRPLPPARVAG